MMRVEELTIYEILRTVVELYDNYPEEVLAEIAPDWFPGAMESIAAYEAEKGKHDNA